MPQLAQVDATWASQLFWLLLTFGVTFLIVGLYMYPRIQGTATARDDKIKGDLEVARLANVSAEADEEAYRVKINDDRAKAQALVAEAKAEAARDAEARLTNIDTQISGRLAQAEAEIAAQKNAAMEEVQSAAAEATQDILMKVAGLKVTKAVAGKQVKAELANG